MTDWVVFALQRELDGVLAMMPLTKEELEEALRLFPLLGKDLSIGSKAWLCQFDPKDNSLTGKDCGFITAIFYSYYHFGVKVYVFESMCETPHYHQRIKFVKENQLMTDFNFELSND
jgi:hypothetical protein